MKQTQLGQSGISISELCLGTMTYGTQTDEAGAHAQLDSALAAGLNFLDTAEMYPVNPVRTETVGLTETIIGNWMAKTGKRDKWVIATKHSGKRDNLRNGQGIGPDTVREVLEGSLRRLQTDYVDLYQFHWPNRAHYHFRRNWAFDPGTQPSRSEILDNMHATMDVLADLVKEGKIRSFGLSNESAWGISQWLAAAAATGGPRAEAVQNEYSLMCRMYDTDLAELGHQEQVTLLAFSPLATGLLTGKYQNDQTPEGSRKSATPELGGRLSPRTEPCVAAYLDIAKKHGLDPVHMALAWCKTRPFPVVPIFGASTQAQLDHVLAGHDVTLSGEVLQDIETAHKAHPMPF